MEIDGKSEKGYITIHTYDQENSASPQVLKRVINDVTRLYPAKSYGLIVFSHGSGWLPPHTLVNGSRSIIIDNDNEMEITDFAMALPDHLFEFIIFEACNMAGIEVAYELRNKAAYIMASSAPVVSPGFTPIYAGSISCLLEENADLQRFAENYFHYWNLMEGDKRSATISIIKTAGLSNLANLIRQINTETSGSFLPVGNLQNYDGVLKAPFYFFDFAQYYQSLSDDNTYNALQECISQCVVYKRNTPFYATEEGTFPITAFSGMTTFIMQRELNDLNEEYTKKYCASFFGPTASKLEQVAFSQYIMDGYLQKHLRKLVREYREKHLYLKKLLDTYLCVSYILDETYMAYWIKLDVDMEKFKSLCESNWMGVSYSSSGIGLSFASMDLSLIHI